MLRKNAFYTYLEKVMVGATLDHYKLHYAIDLAGQTAESFNVDLTFAYAELKPLGGNAFELEKFNDTIPNNLCVINLKTNHSGGPHKVPLEGSILLKTTAEGQRFKERYLWDQIAVKLAIDHPHLQDHDGSSTSHMGDGD